MEQRRADIPVEFKSHDLNSLGGTGGEDTPGVIGGTVSGTASWTNVARDFRALRGCSCVCVRGGGRVSVEE